MQLVKHPPGVEISDVASVRALSKEPFGDRKWPIRYDSLEPLAMATDFITIVFSSVLSGLSYHLHEAGTPVDISKSIGAGILVSTLFVSLLKMRGMYRPTELLVLRNQIRAVCLAWISVFLLLAGTVFALKIGSELSRGTSILFAMYGLIALLLHRGLLKDLLQKGVAGSRFSGRNIVLITDNSQMSDGSLTHTLSGLGFRVKESFVFPDPGMDLRQRETIVARVIERTRGSDVQEIVVGADPNRWSELRSLVAELRVLPFPVSFIPLGTASEIFRRPSRELGSAICVELQRGPLTSTEQAAKRCIDAIAAGVALAVVLPLLAVVAIAIKLDSPGPVLFRQQRCGFNGRCFQVFKFRTMSVIEDGPSIVQAQLADNE